MHAVQHAGTRKARGKTNAVNMHALRVSYRVIILCVFVFKQLKRNDWNKFASAGFAVAPPVLVRKESYFFLPDEALHLNAQVALKLLYHMTLDPQTRLRTLLLKPDRI